MLREFAAAAPPVARLLRIVAAGAAVLAIAGCGIKGPLRLPSAPPGAGTAAPSAPSPATAPKTDPGAIPPDASPRG
jgi:predicted small lipoprotein YifL